MKTFRYNLSGHWYKGNTHIHSTASDGGLDFDQLAELYGSAGYHFLFRTDHWLSSSTNPNAGSQNHHQNKKTLLWLDGIEMDARDATGAYFHICGLGKLDGLDRAAGLEACLAAAHAQGALLVLAHPQWTGNTFDDALRHPFDGVEVYNHVVHWLNGKSNGLVYWESLLRRDPAALALAVDDAHIRPEHPGWNGGWLVVNAPELAPAAILAALRAGNYYSSCGPDFLDLRWDGQSISLVTSPVQFIRLVGPNYHGQRVGSFDGQLLTQASFTVPGEWPYAYLEIEDAGGKRAWTNCLLLSAD